MVEGEHRLAERYSNRICGDPMADIEEILGDRVPDSGRRPRSDLASQSAAKRSPVNADARHPLVAEGRVAAGAPDDAALVGVGIFVDQSWLGR
jgi:hypothetical protein